MSPENLSEESNHEGYNFPSCLFNSQHHSHRSISISLQIDNIITLYHYIFSLRAPTQIMAKSVIILGASGNVGTYIIKELLNQRSKFNRIAILSDPAKVDKFADAKAKGIEVISGSFLDSSSFKGVLSYCIPAAT